MTSLPTTLDLIRAYQQLTITSNQKKAVNKGNQSLFSVLTDKVQQIWQHASIPTMTSKSTMNKISRHLEADGPRHKK